MASNLLLPRLRAKTLRVAKVLEKFLGVPTQSPRRPPPLDMLIATVLSQNTNDKNSYRAYTLMREAYPTWKHVVDTSWKKLAGTIRAGGMANQKSKRIQEILNDIHARYGKYDLSALKRKSNEAVMKDLTALNGVGPKTASCVLLFSLGRDIFPVDTHVHRICNRLGLVMNANTPEKTFESMRLLVPVGRGYSFHTNLIRFGRRVCRSANPACDICPLFDECAYEKKRTKGREKRHQSHADHDFMLLDNVKRPG